MNFPDHLLYTRTHEWLRREGDLATIGITAHAVEQLGDLVFLELPKPRSRVLEGQPFGEIESTKTASELIAPVSGEVIEVHQTLVDELDSLKESPYEAGWMIRVRIEKESELAGLLNAKQYSEHVSREEH